MDWPNVLTILLSGRWVKFYLSELNGWLNIIRLSFHENEFNILKKKKNLKKWCEDFDYWWYGDKWSKSLDYFLMFSSSNQWR